MVPTSSVSASIKRLETELGCKLFNRTHNKITLNENGKRLKQAVAVAFSELDQAVHELSDTSTDEREIKMLVRAMRSNITDYIIEFKEKHPKISFKTVFDFYENNFEEYDIIITSKKISYLDISDFNERYTVCSYYRQESAYGNVKDFLDFLKNKAI